MTSFALFLVIPFAPFSDTLLDLLMFKQELEGLYHEWGDSYLPANK